MEAVRVKQTQTGKVTGLAQLFRGRCQQQYRRCAPGKAFNQCVLFAWLLFVPDQVMRFIDNEHVPVGLVQIVPCLVVFQQELQRDQCQLGLLEGVVFGTVAAVGIEQCELQIEATAHLDQPLMLQVLRYDDQHATDAAGLQLAMQDQAGFDGFAQTHFVSQQHAWRHAVGNVAGDMQLMADRLGAYSGQAKQRRALDAAEMAQAFKAQAEPGQGVDLAGEQTIAGQPELNEIVQHGFGKGGRGAVVPQAGVGQQTILFDHVADDHAPAFVVGNAVARTETHAGKRRVAQRVVAGFAAGGEEHDYQAGVLRQYRTETQFRFAVADPALSGGKTCHAALLVVQKRAHILPDRPGTRNRGVAPIRSV